MDEQVEIEGDIDRMAPLFEGAPPFNVELTYDEISMILTGFQGLAALFVSNGEDTDELYERILPLKEKFQIAMQTYLDSPEGQTP